MQPDEVESKRDHINECAKHETIEVVVVRQRNESTELLETVNSEFMWFQVAASFEDTSDECARDLIGIARLDLSYRSVLRMAIMAQRHYLELSKLHTVHGYDPREEIVAQQRLTHILSEEFALRELVKKAGIDADHIRTEYL